LFFQHFIIILQGDSIGLFVPYIPLLVFNFFLVSRSIEFCVLGTTLLAPRGKIIFASRVFSKSFSLVNNFAFLALLATKLRSGWMDVYNCHVV
jgi:hypothetical protein